MTGRILRFGIVGFGKMGRIRMRELLAHPQAELVAVADPNPEAADGQAGVPCHKDYRRLLEDNIDAVIVCTPNRFTAETVIAALEAGKHVFSEKPPGRSVEDTEAIIATERRHPGLKLKFGFNHRCHAGIQEAKRMVDSGRLGEILWLRGIYGKSGGPDFERTWRSSRELCGGGILLDQGIHMLDLFRFFCGDFVEIKSMVGTSHWRIDVEDNAFALLRDARGRVAMLHSSSTQWKHRFSLEIYLSEGYLSVNGLLTSSRSYGEETITVARRQFDEGFSSGRPREETIYFDTDPSWAMEIAEFIDSIQTGRPIQSGASSDALKAMQMVFAIYRNDPSHWERIVGDASPAMKDRAASPEGR